MREVMVDFITSLDGYASAEGWLGFWGLQGPEYLGWLDEQPEVTYLMGANTYRLKSGFAAGEVPAGQDEFADDEEASVDHLTRAPKVVFSSTLEEPVAWANTTLVRGDAATGDHPPSRLTPVRTVRSPGLAFSRVRDGDRRSWANRRRTGVGLGLAGLHDLLEPQPPLDHDVARDEFSV